MTDRADEVAREVVRKARPLICGCGEADCPRLVPVIANFADVATALGL